MAVNQQNYTQRKNKITQQRTKRIRIMSMIKPIDIKVYGCKGAQIEQIKRKLHSAFDKNQIRVRYKVFPNENVLINYVSKHRNAFHAPLTESKLICTGKPMINLGNMAIMNDINMTMSTLHKYFGTDVAMKPSKHVQQPHYDTNKKHLYRMCHIDIYGFKSCVDFENMCKLTSKLKTLNLITSYKHHRLDDLKQLEHVIKSKMNMLPSSSPLSKSSPSSTIPLPSGHKQSDTQIKSFGMIDKTKPIHNYTQLKHWLKNNVQRLKSIRRASQKVSNTNTTKKPGVDKFSSNLLLTNEKVKINVDSKKLLASPRTTTETYNRENIQSPTRHVYTKNNSHSYRKKCIPCQITIDTKNQICPYCYAKLKSEHKQTQI